MMRSKEPFPRSYHPVHLVNPVKILLSDSEREEWIAPKLASIETQLAFRLVALRRALASSGGVIPDEAFIEIG